MSHYNHQSDQSHQARVSPLRQTQPAALVSNIFGIRLCWKVLWLNADDDEFTFSADEKHFALVHAVWTKQKFPKGVSNHCTAPLQEWQCSAICSLVILRLWCWLKWMAHHVWVKKKKTHENNFKNFPASWEKMMDSGRPAECKSFYNHRSGFQSWACTNCFLYSSEIMLKQAKIKKRETRDYFSKSVSPLHQFVWETQCQTYTCKPRV